QPHAGRATDPQHACRDRLFGAPGQSSKEGLKSASLAAVGNKTLRNDCLRCDGRHSRKMLGRAKLGWIGLDVPPTTSAFLGSNEATYGLREGGAGFHRNRPAAGKAKPTLSAGIVRRVRNADDR